MYDVVDHHVSIRGTKMLPQLHQTTYLVEAVVGEQIHEVVLLVHSGRIRVSNRLVKLFRQGRTTIV